MGLFKNLKGTMDQAGEMTAQAQQMQENAMAQQQAANAPVDLDDPMWEPIEGVTLDQYAQVTAALATQNLGGVENVKAWVETQGVPEGTWETVQNGWVQRMGANEAVRTRYGVLYSQG